MLLEPLLQLVRQNGLEENPEAVFDLIGEDKALQILELIEAETDEERYLKFKHLFPDMAECELVTSVEEYGSEYRYRQVGSFKFFARDYYQKHLEFFRNGATFRARCMMAANRVGKTFSAGGYELTCHLTGDYPHWWEGKRFRHPIRAWACGKTNETTRDIVQTTLLGEIEYRGSLKRVDGTGVVPREKIGADPGQLTWKQGVQDLVDTVKVKHVSGGWSKLGLKCHPASSRVLMANGEWRNIDQVRIGELIRSPDGRARPVSQLHAYASAPVIRLVTRCGPLLATPNHPVMTDRGMMRADEVRLGHVMVPLYRDHEGAAAEDWRVILTALMIGDGCTRGNTPFFTCNEPEIVKMVEAALPPDLRLSPVNNTISYRLYSTEKNKNRLTASLRADGLWGKTSHHKFIPNWVFQLPREQRVLFLRWLWTCDGSVNSRLSYYCSASERLIQDVRLLLASVGIFAPVEHYMATCNGKQFPARRITLYGAERAAFAEIGKLNRDNSYSGKPRPKGPRGEVIRIEEMPVQPVYCVGVEDVHELIVDGFHVGNSYQQGRGSFEGTAQHVIWDDEEPPEDVYGEQIIRTATTGGIMMLTFTPLEGMSEVVQRFLPGVGID